MRLRRRLYVAAAALAALVLIVWQAVFHGQHPRLIWQRPPLRPQQVLAPLEQVGSLHCENARLSTVLPLLNEQFGVDITIDTTTLQGTGLPTDGVVSLSLDNVRAETMLHLLLRQVDPRLIPSIKDGHLVITDHTQLVAQKHLLADSMPGKSFGRYYALPFSGHESLISDLTDLNRDSWDVLGGPAAVAATPRALLVYQDPRFQQQLQHLLRIVSEPDDFSVDPLPIGPRDAALEQALQKVVRVRFDDRPLHECLRDVARQAGVAIWIDDSESDTLRSSTLEIEAPLKVVLACLLANTRLDCYVRQDVLLIARRDSVADFEMRAYPVHDLLSSQSGDEFLDTVASLIRPEEWEDLGGAGERVLLGEQLVVRHSRTVHWEVESLLEKWRVAAGLTEASPGLARELRLWHRLGAAVDFSFDGASLDQASRELAAHLDSPVVVDYAELLDKGVFESQKIRLTGASDGQPLGLWLERLLWQHDLTWMVLPGGVLQLTHLSVGGPRVQAAQRPRRWMHQNDGLHSEYVFSVIESLAEPEHWSTVGGPGELFILGDVLLVCHHPYVVLQVEQLLQMIDLAEHESDPEQMYVLGQDMLQMNRVRRVLDEAADMKFVDCSLGDVAQWLRENVSLELEFDGSLRDMIFDGEYQSQPLRTSLAELLMQHDLFLDMRPAGLIARRRTDAPPMMTASFFVGDLLAGDLSVRERRELQLQEAVVNGIDVDSWSLSRGEGELAVAGEVIVIRNNWRTLRRVRRLLAQLRQQRNRPGPFRVGVTDDQPTIAADHRLTQPISVDTRGQSREQVIGYLSEKCKVPVVWPSNAAADWYLQRPASPSLLLNVPARRVLEELLRGENFRHVLVEGVAVVDSPKEGALIASQLREGDTRGVAPWWSDFGTSFHPAPRLASHFRRLVNAEGRAWNEAAGEPSFGMGKYDDPLVFGLGYGVQWILPMDNGPLHVMTRSSVTWGTESMGSCALLDDYLVLSGTIRHRQRMLDAAGRLAASFDNQPVPPPLAPRQWNQAVSLRCRDEFVTEVLQRLAEQTGLPLIVDETPPLEKLKATLQADDQPLSQIVRQLLEHSGMVAVEREQEIWITERAKAFGELRYDVVDISRLMQQRPNLTAAEIRELVGEAVLPLTWNGKTHFIARLGNLLFVQHTARGVQRAQAVLERLEAARSSQQLLRDMQSPDPVVSAAAIGLLARQEPDPQLGAKASQRLLEVTDDRVVLQLAKMIQHHGLPPGHSTEAFERHLDREVASPLRTALRRAAAHLGAPGGVLLGRRLRAVTQGREGVEETLDFLQQHPPAAQAAMADLLWLCTRSQTSSTAKHVIRAVDPDLSLAREQLEGWRRSDNEAERSWARELLPQFQKQ